MTLREFLATHQRRPHLPTHVSGSLEDWLAHGELSDDSVWDRARGDADDAGA